MEEHEVVYFEERRKKKGFRNYRSLEGEGAGGGAGFGGLEEIGASGLAARGWVHEDPSAVLA